MATGVSHFLFRIFVGPFLLGFFQFFMLEVPLNFIIFFSGANASMMGFSGTCMFAVAVSLRIRDYVRQKSESRVTRFGLALLIGTPWLIGLLTMWRICVIGLDGMLQEVGIANQVVMDSLQFVAGGCCSWFQFWESRTPNGANIASNWLLEGTGTDDESSDYTKTACKLMACCVTVQFINNIWFSGLLPGQPLVERGILHLLGDTVFTIACYVIANRLYEEHELDNIGIEFPAICTVMHFVLLNPMMMRTGPEIVETVLLLIHSFLITFAVVKVLDFVNRRLD